ncbi:MAG: hypothetical protein JSR77_00335 [Planctomycetes bacterium]|nr:hypothetical protein [Planctomycetota bacterium]
MAVTNNSSSADFYLEALGVLQREMANEEDDIGRINALRREIDALNDRMADAAFADIRNRTDNLRQLIAQLQNVTQTAAGGATANDWVKKVNGIIGVAQNVLDATGLGAAIGGGTRGLRAVSAVRGKSVPKFKAGKALRSAGKPKAGSKPKAAKKSKGRRKP